MKRNKHPISTARCHLFSIGQQTLSRKSAMLYPISIARQTDLLKQKISLGN
jgi:hypothetical protein